MKKSNYDDEYFEGDEDFINDNSLDDSPEEDFDTWEDKFDEMTDNDYEIDWNDPEVQDMYKGIENDDLDDMFDEDIDDQEADNWDI